MCFQLWDALNRVLRLPSVCSKRFLTNKVDRSVTGRVVQQQCCGPLQTPIADYALMSLGSTCPSPCFQACPSTNLAANVPNGSTNLPANGSSSLAANPSTSLAANGSTSLANGSNWLSTSWIHRLVGAATAIGEQPIKVLVDSRKGARLTVAEALLNLVFVSISGLSYNHPLLYFFSFPSFSRVRIFCS